MTSSYPLSRDDDVAIVRVADLVQRTASDGMVVELGYAAGPLAESLRDRGYGYLGCHADESGVKDLRLLGFDAHKVDLRDARAVEQQLLDLLGNRPVAAFVLLDVLTRLPQPAELLSTLRRLSVHLGAVPLIVSVPNVAHYDVAAKLLLGRWDVAQNGLLNQAHVALFTHERLRSTMSTSGWREVAAADVALASTDQHFPGDLAALATGAPLHDLLAAVAAKASPATQVSQFVRTYLPGPTPIPREEREGDRPFVTVLTRTQGSRMEELQDLLLCFSGQSDQDFELLILAHGVGADRSAAISEAADALPESVRSRVRLVPVEAGGGRCRPLNVGVREARGEYVAVVDDDDLVLAHWVECFHSLARRFPGRMLRTPSAVQFLEVSGWPGDPNGYRVARKLENRYPPQYDLIETLLDNRTPPCGLAFPTSLFRDLGVCFDEKLDVLEDWDVQLQAAILCGVASSPEITAIYRRWPGGNSVFLHDKNIWESDRTAVVAKLDRTPLLLPTGSASRLRSLLKEHRETQDALRRAQADHMRARKQLEEQIASERARTAEIRRDLEQSQVSAAKDAQRLRTNYENSWSWRLTRPIRALTGVVRRVRRRRG